MIVDLHHPCIELIFVVRLNWNGFECVYMLKGSFGEVFRARHRRGGFEVAIKVVPINSPQEAQDLKQEIDILKQCSNPNIVTYYGCSGPDR